MSGMQIYSKDLRIRALAAVGRGNPRRVLREIFSVSLTTLKRWLKIGRDREGGQGPLARALHGKE
jgi:transposase